MLFMWAYFFINYESVAGAVIAISCIGSSLFLGSIMLILFKDDNNAIRCGQFCKFRFPIWPINFPQSYDSRDAIKRDSIDISIHNETII